MLVKFLLTLLVGFTLSSLPAAALFKDRKAGWDTMTQEQKQFYIMGMTDQWYMVPTEYSDDAYIMDMSDCMLDMKIGAKALVSIVDFEYQDPENWDFSIMTQLLRGMKKACLTRINAARLERGEEPLP